MKGRVRVNAPLRPRPFPDEMMVVRVPMTRPMYARLLAEAVMLNRSPDVVVREILACAFASGDVSALFPPNDQSVASASPKTRSNE